jgi:hypothetical protein
MKDNCPLCTGPAIIPAMDRRAFLSRFGLGLGGVALGSLLNPLDGTASAAAASMANLPHFAPKAKRVIFLFMSGGPSQMELFDYKPLLNKRNGEQLPDSVRQGQRLTGMSANQSSLPMAGSLFKFAQHGESGAWVSELLPHTAGIADDLCILKTLHTDEINHDPAITFLQTGSPLSGRPSIGAWMSYGLGSLNQNLPSFVVLITRGKGDQPLYARLWGSGFLPAEHQGVQFRGGEDAVLHLANPEGVSSASRRKLFDRFRELHEHEYTRTGDDALNGRIEQYEMAFRMQSSVPDVTDLSDEPDHVFDEYGPDARTPGTFAANCLLARRLAERDVQFIQLYHRGWDQHGNLPNDISTQCKETDQPSAALVRDLKRRGLLEDTLVIWGGEFGRTSYSQGPLTETNYGRDHHPRCFTVWMAGGGVKPGLSYGVTDEFSYNIVENPVHVHDFHATLLHLMGIDHERLTYRFQGRRFRLTDVHGEVVKGLLA